MHSTSLPCRESAVSAVYFRAHLYDRRVVSQGVNVDADVCRGPRNNYTNKETERKQQREIRRVDVLDKWEKEHPDKAYKKPQLMVCTIIK